MSLVNYETGEVIEYDRAAAERRAERIRLRLDSIADNYAAVMPMIREAIEKRDDVALGYRSVSEYVSDRFGGALTRLGVEVRREVVRELTEAGMSTRAIAPIVGTSHETVRADVRSGVKDLTPGPTPQGEAPPSDATPEREQATAPEPAAPRPAAKPIVGIDGKEYARPEPKPARRKPQRDDAENYLNLAQSYADQAARQAAKLSPAQIERVKPNAAHWVSGIRESVETLQRLLTSLTEE